MSAKTWKQGAAERRDERHTKAPEVADGASLRGGRKKDTKRWCKGKVGREHQPKCTPHLPGLGIFDGWFDLACSVCGKVLDRHWPLGRRERADRPDWVKEENDG